MAIYHLSAKVISRGKGQSAIAAAAYRSGERLRDEQTGEQKFYREGADRIIFTDIMAPRDAPEWAHDRNELWNQAERAEKRKDGQLAREIEVALPHELTDQQREYLVKDFAREAFVRKGYAVDIAIHAPYDESDQRNYHAHLMISMRQLGPDGFAATKDRSLNSAEQLTGWREQFAHLTNRHLERHGIEARIDHRSLEAQGIDRSPTVHVGYAGMEIDARGGQSDRMQALHDVMERNDIRLELLRLQGELVPLEALHAGHMEAEKERREALAEEAERAFWKKVDKQADAEQELWEKAYKQLEKAARADNAMLLRKPEPGDMSFEQSVATAVRQEYLDARAEAAQEAWRIWAAEQNLDRIRPDAKSLEVMDSVTGAVSKLGDFVLDLLSGASPRPAPREIDMAALVSDPAARKAHQLAQFAAMREASDADKALDRIRVDWEAGRRLQAEDIRTLTHDHLAAIHKGGDDVVRQMVEDARKRREDENEGRERER